MNTLFLNTATSETGIALSRDGEVFEKRWPSEQNEAETLQPNVEQLLTEQGLTPDDIDQLLVCVGPGGFTSTRVGVSAANAWAFAKQIPVAAVSVFDLFPAGDSWVMVSANRSEGWIQSPGGEPEWVEIESLELPESFVFTGILSEDWVTSLEQRGGTYQEQQATVPSLTGVSFSQQILEPWYYKDPNITWSKKIPRQEGS